MSDFQAIGGVSATLQRLLKDRMELPLGVTAAMVTMSAPPQLPNPPTVEDPRVNLFLFRVTENGLLKNQDLVGHGHPAAYGHPPLSLDLHYLLTAYGTTVEGELVNEGRAQQLLGSAMRVLHDHPVITKDLVTIQPPANQSILDDSLQAEYEDVKLNLDPLGLEDLSKVWTALSLPFRLSAVYSISVVQIESQRSRRMAPPVRARRLHVTPLRRPQITAVHRTPTAPGEPIGDQRVRIGDSISVEGLNFSADATWIRLGSLDPIALPAPVADDEIVQLVPDQAALQPGPQVVQVRTRRPTEVVEGGLGPGQVVPGDAVRDSNQAVFMLVPEITPPVSADPNFTVLTVNGSRLFRDGLNGFVLVGDRAIEIRRSTAQDPIPWAAPTPTSVQVPLPTLPPGSYAIRVRVNGAESMEEGVELLVP